MSPPESPLLLLEHPPEVVSAGYATHGHCKREHYRFDDYWCLHLYHYRLRLDLDRRENILEPGDMTVIPPGVRMVFHFAEPRCRHYYALFRLRARGSGARLPVPLVHRGRADREAITAEFGEAASSHNVEPARARARIWSILWRLATAVEKPLENAPNEFFRDARDRIERNLASALTVAGLARDLGVSHNHLTRAFRRHAGTTVVAYLRAQRMARARYLLQHTTLPVKRIAFECGIPDLHLFNKTVRACFGRSPRRMREADSAAPAR